MAGPIIYRSTGDVIPAEDHNVLGSYLEDGTYRINTLSLEIQGNNVIDSNRNIVTSGSIVGSNPFIVNSTNDGDELLRFNTDRSWSFYQEGSDAETNLNLQSSNSDKSFYIRTDAGSPIISFRSDSSPNSGKQVWIHQDDEGNFLVGNTLIYASTHNGQVGINTQNPSTEFEVVGNGSFTGSTTASKVVVTDSGSEWSLNISGTLFNITSPNSSDIIQLDKNTGGADIVNLTANPSFSGAVPLSVETVDGQTANAFEVGSNNGENFFIIDSSGNGSLIGSVEASNLITATTTNEGFVELATTSEVDTGTDTSRAVVPDVLAASYAGTKSHSATVIDYGTDVSTGDGKYYFAIPEEVGGMNLVDVGAEVITAGTTGTTDIQIHNYSDSVDMLSTKITIDSGETSSETAATPPSIDTANDDVVEGDIIRVDVDSVSTTPPKGLIVRCTFRLP